MHLSIDDMENISLTLTKKAIMEIIETIASLRRQNVNLAKWIAEEKSWKFLQTFSSEEIIKINLFERLIPESEKIMDELSSILDSFKDNFCLLPSSFNSLLTIIQKQEEIRGILSKSVK